MPQIKRPLRLVLVRHGESEANVYQKLLDEGEVFNYPREFSDISDWNIPLTETGKEQARATGKYLKERFGVFDACYVSPFQRTRETFAGIVEGHEDETQKQTLLQRTRFDSRLREKERGAINFLSGDEIKRFFPHEFERRRREGKYAYRPLGGESWYDVKDLRVGNILNTIYRDQIGKSVLIVTHSIVIQCFKMKLEHIDEEDISNLRHTNPTKNCGITLYEYDPAAGEDGKLVLKEWNTVAY